MATMMAAVMALACAQDAPVELRWKFEKGREMLYRFNQKQAFEIQGAAMEQAFGFTALLKVEDVGADGLATVTFTYKAVTAKGTGLMEFE